MPSDTTRAVLGLAVLAGAFVMLLGGAVLLPLLGGPLGLLAAGVVGAVPTLVLLTPRIGSRRAVLLAGVVAVVLALLFLVAGFAAWLLGA